jgi:hypothetical protein
LALAFLLFAVVPISLMIVGFSNRVEKSTPNFSPLINDLSMAQSGIPTQSPAISAFPSIPPATDLSTVQSGIPTQSPAVSAFPGPTLGSTLGPTSGPTTGLTLRPTSGPTSRPTWGPTSRPSLGPTNGPALGPTLGSASGPLPGPTHGLPQPSLYHSIQLTFPETTVLQPNKSLERGEFAYSPSRAYQVRLTNTGDLVLLDSDSSRTIWSAGTTGGYRCYVQDDGNVVVKSCNNQHLWTNHRYQNPGAHLVVNDYASERYAMAEWHSARNLQKKWAIVQ